jgi:hypothetical protein
MEGRMAEERGLLIDNLARRFGRFDSMTSSVKQEPKVG